MNNVVLIGRLTKDIELKYTQSQTAVASFTLAVNRDFKNKDGQTEADFISCQVWRKQAETLAQYTHKGSQIAVQGRLNTRSYENQQGQKVYVTEVIVNNFQFLDSKNNGQQSSNQSTDQFASNATGFDESNLPF